MNFDPTDEQKQLRLEIIDFCRKAGLNDDIDTRDRVGEFPRALFEKIGQGPGLQGLAVSKEFGGRGLDPLTTIVALEAFGYACEDNGLVSSVCAQLLSTAVPLAKFGTEEQKKALLPGLCDGSKIGATATAEADLALTAVREGDDYLLNGTLTLVTNGPVGDLALVFAVTAPDAELATRITSFIVPLDAPGLVRGEALDTLGNRTAPVGDLTLENVRVPATAILGGSEGNGQAVLNHAQNWERVGFSAARVGAMQRLTEATIKHVRSRKQRNQPPAHSEGHSHTVAQMRIRLDTSRLLVSHAASRLESAREATLNASVAATFVGDSSIRTAQEALQIHGGAGSLNATGLARPVRDALGSPLHSGPSEAQRRTIAESLGL